MSAITQNEDRNESAATMPVEIGRSRPFYWSVRRELWEHRALWMAPLVAAALILLSFVVNSLHLPGGRVLTNIEPGTLRAIATGFYGAVSSVIVLTMIIVTWFYCLDALYSERRDRSILFWKSLPVSDVTTVSSKLFVAAAVAPSISFTIVVATQLVILLIGSAIVLFAGGSPGALWSSVSLLQLTLALLYFLVVQAIWFAPLLAWLIFASAGVRRSPTLGALAVPAALCLVEKLALGTGHIFAMLKNWVTDGFLKAAFTFTDGDTPTRVQGGFFNLHVNIPSRTFEAIDPMKFLSTPAVWIGLAIAAALLAATVWMRRYREPL